MPPPLSSALRDVLDQLASPFTGEALFDCLTDVVYFIKNAQGQYVVVNWTLVERCGLREKSELIGRTPGEVLRPPLGARFQAQDRRVLRTRRPLVGQLELHVYPTGDVGWCLTSKLPLLGHDGLAVGLVGVSRDLRLPDSTSDDYHNVVSALSLAESRLESPPTLGEMAGRAGLSRYQLDRRMLRVFGLTAGQWLAKLRLDHARCLLSETDESVAAVAQQSGYSDQSAFTRQFREATGLTPRQYRETRSPHGY